MPRTTVASVTQLPHESLEAVIDRARTLAVKDDHDVIIVPTKPPSEELRINPDGALHLRASHKPNERLAGADVIHVNEALGLARRTGLPVVVSCYNHLGSHALINPSMSEAEALHAYFQVCDHPDHGS